MALLVVAELNYTVISGGSKFRIQADVQGAANNNERKLVWSEPNGCVDNGIFTIPDVKMPTVYTVTVKMLEDLSRQEQITVTVMPKKIIKKINDLKVWQHGSGDNSFLTIQILDNEGVGFKGKIKLSESLNPAAVFSVFTLNPIECETDDAGALSVPLDQTALVERLDRFIHIQAMGSGQDDEVFLYQIRPEKCPRCKSPRWNGVKCLTCNYPKSRKAR